MTDTSNSPLLAYFAITDPGTFAPGRFGYVTMAIAPGLIEKVQCDKVVITVPYGGPDDIFTDKPITQNHSSNDWSIGLTEPTQTEQTVTITLESKFLGTRITNTFTFQIAGTINHFKGTKTISLVENSAIDNGGQNRPNYTSKKGSSSVNAGGSNPLAITSFLAQAPTDANQNEKASPLIPVTEFKRNAPVRLVWNAANAQSFELYQGNTICNLKAGMSTYTVSNGLIDTTVFTLIAHGAAGQAVSSTLTIIVENPLIQTLDVAGNTVLGTDPAKDSLTVNASTTNKGPVNLDGPVTTNQSLTINGPLISFQGGSFNGQVKLAELTVSESVNINKGLEVHGDALIDGSFKVRGTGGKTQTASLKVDNQRTLDLVGCFPAYYSYFEVVLTNISPSINFDHLQAVYGINSTWRGDALYNGNAWGNDSGSNGYEVYNRQPEMRLWPLGKAGPIEGTGLSGTLSFPDLRESAFPSLFGNLYAPVAYGSNPQVASGCQVMVTCSFPTKEAVTGIRLFFSKGNISGRAAVFGWN